jgi:hypothetical protein
MRPKLRHTLAFVAALASVSTSARADSLSKEECVDAHSRGQDAREQGKLSLARKLFLTCAQSACPALVQGDCARFADDLSRQQPTVSFAARDGAGGDLPDTTVYVDDVLVVTHLDGKPHDLDPGTHVVKFTNAGRDEVVTVVVGSGEKGRAIAGVFSTPGGRGARAGGSVVRTHAAPTAASAAPKPTIVRPTGAKLVIGLGATVAVGGIALGLFGISKVPANCAISTHTCAAPPGDASFSDAASGVQIMNIGFAVGVVGVAAVAGGVVWYLKGGKSSKESPMVATPWVTPDGGGLAVSGSL